MITDMSRNGLAMAPPYPFFAGAFAAAAGAGALAGRVCAAGGGVISADIWNKKACIAVFFSSCLVSLISIFWKYPERFKAVMKFATELTDAEDPSIDSVLPFRVMSVSHRFSVRET